MSRKKSLFVLCIGFIWFDTVDHDTRCWIYDLIDASLAEEAFVACHKMHTDTRSRQNKWSRRTMRRRTGDTRATHRQAWCLHGRNSPCIRCEQHIIHMESSSMGVAVGVLEIFSYVSFNRRYNSVSSCASDWLISACEMRSKWTDEIGSDLSLSEPKMSRRKDGRSRSASLWMVRQMRDDLCQWSTVAVNIHVQRAETFVVSARTGQKTTIRTFQYLYELLNTRECRTLQRRSGTVAHCPRLERWRHMRPEFTPIEGSRWILRWARHPC